MRDIFRPVNQTFIGKNSCCHPEYFCWTSFLPPRPDVLRQLTKQAAGTTAGSSGVAAGGNDSITASGNDSVADGGSDNDAPGLGNIERTSIVDLRVGSDDDEGSGFMVDKEVRRQL